MSAGTRTELATVTADVVVIGSGVAGLAAALHARGLDVVLLTKSTYGSGGSSPAAQGGVAAAVGPGDSPAAHAADTFAAGCGLCAESVVRSVTAEGPRRIRELLDLGAALDRTAGGALALGREGAHSRARIAHADGDATGAELVRALATAAASSDRVRIHDRVQAVELVRRGRRVVGVLAVDRAGDPRLYSSGAVVLAAGGAGRLFRHTTNPAECTADALAMAARAGARLANLEMVQFHPTALADGSDPAALLTEALRGEGAILLDEHGRRFMTEVDPRAELAPRDVVARAIWRHREAGHRVFLDATRLGGRLAESFPTVLGLCAARGLDPAREPIPVTPAAHYHMGGVVVDDVGRTSLPGLMACGECAHSGLHGANRLASNSLLEALVYGARVGETVRREAASVDHVLRVLDAADRLPTDLARRTWLADDPAGAEVVGAVREIMWQQVGMERDEGGLRRAEMDLADLEHRLPPGLGEARNVLEAAQLVTHAARARTESRGAHFRRDIPWTDPAWRQDLVFAGRTMLEPREVAMGSER
jgi:L-aspartate oxidase